MDKEAITIFREVLLLCDEMGLIGKEMFAIDGCKLSFNAAKEWSGTRADFKKKAAGMEKAIEPMVKNHHVSDRNQGEKTQASRDEKYMETLRKRLAKIRNWLDNNDDKPGKTGKPRKSNITDNDSAKMKISKRISRPLPKTITSLPRQSWRLTAARTWRCCTSSRLMPMWQPPISGSGIPALPM